MRNLFRPLCLTALIAVAPTVLIGCSGGSSSNRSDSKTRADLTFSVDGNTNALKPLKARGLFKPKVISETGPYPYEGNGVYTFFDHTELPNRDEGDGHLITYVVANVNGVNRAFFLKRITYNGAYGGETGSTYNFRNLDNTLASFVNFEKDKNYTYLANQSENGVVSVIAHDGNYVTLQLTNVNLNSLDDPTAIAPASVKVNGTITYKIRRYRDY